VRLVACSPIYETPPWGYSDQPKFLNQVVRVETDLPPAELLAYLKLLEAHQGRQPSFQYGPRLIDLDILFFDDKVIQTPALSIPHPRLPERAFVLVPLADLAPNLVHPILGITVQEMLAQVDAADVAHYQPAECEQEA
jgi:2-amino-4-hydroxy-6-hydroxymethyldihydropteridine diphosphokinase